MADLGKEPGKVPGYKFNIGKKEKGKFILKMEPQMTMNENQEPGFQFRC